MKLKVKSWPEGDNGKFDLRVVLPQTSGHGEFVWSVIPHYHLGRISWGRGRRGGRWLSAAPGTFRSGYSAGPGSSPAWSIQDSYSAERIGHSADSVRSLRRQNAWNTY